MALTLGANSNDGYLDYGDLSDLNGATALSLLFWSSGGDAVNNFHFAKGTLLLCGMTGRGILIRDTAAGWILTAPGQVVPVGLWTSYAVIYDGSQAATDRMAFYRNAEWRALFGADDVTPQGTDAGSTAPTALPNYSDPFRVSQSNISGHVSHVRLYTAPLSAAEVAQEMYRYWASRRTNLLIDSPYDDALFARDYSGNGTHPTVVRETGPVQVASPMTYGGKVLVTG